MTLQRSHDRKVANLVGGKTPVSKIANSFGLPSGQAYSCPGATNFCTKICYAGKLEKIYKGTRAVLLRNWNTILEADYLQGVPGMVTLLNTMITEFETDCDKKGASKDFRIHWDGDFFSSSYTRAWREVIKSHPNVSFWAYTRSFDIVPYLCGLYNLSLYISADSDNMEQAKSLADYYNLPLATVADTFADARAMMGEVAGKTYPCPENKGSLPLISDKGSACARCGICPDNRGHVLFSVKKR